jgi:hypothetical protein
MKLPCLITTHRNYTVYGSTEDKFPYIRGPDTFLLIGWEASKEQSFIYIAKVLTPDGRIEELRTGHTLKETFDKGWMVKVSQWRLHKPTT